MREWLFNFGKTLVALTVFFGALAVLFFSIAWPFNTGHPIVGIAVVFFWCCSFGATVLSGDTGGYR